MKPYAIAVAWAALLIFLPLAASAGLVTLATVKGLTPVLTVLAAIHITNRGWQCRLRPQRETR